jgi:hypothetical protein
MTTTKLSCSIVFSVDVTLPALQFVVGIQAAQANTTAELSEEVRLRMRMSLWKNSVDSFDCTETNVREKSLACNII